MGTFCTELRMSINYFHTIYLEGTELVEQYPLGSIYHLDIFHYMALVC